MVSVASFNDGIEDEPAKLDSQVTVLKRFTYQKPADYRFNSSNNVRLKYESMQLYLKTYIKQ